MNRQAPTDNQTLRSRIFAGDIFLLPATEPSRRLVADVEELLVETFAGAPLREIHRHFGDAELFTRVGAIRRTLFLDPYYHDAVRAVARAQGFASERLSFDPIRLRVVLHDGHKNPRARTVYYPHRDTWYSHPQSAITWWIPLADLRAEETFVFYPDEFDQVVPNDSERFDYATWVREDWDLKIGWQDRDAGLTAAYPGVVGAPEFGREVGFSCSAGANLLFASAQFHRTREQSLGTSRFSLDFRVVHHDDLGDDRDSRRGAVNVDNRSTGSALVDYVGPPT